MKINIKDIKIGPRQRIELGDLKDLDSMAEPGVGQIQAIGVNQNMELIWGRRRLAKATALGWEQIETEVRPCSVEDQQLIELYEDIGRKNRTWQEKCIAFLSIYQVLSHKSALKSERFSISMMEDLTGFDRTHLQYIIRVAEQLKSQDKELYTCSNYTEAVSLLRSRNEKAAQAEQERRLKANPVVAVHKGKVITQADVAASQSLCEELASTGIIFTPSVQKPTALSLYDRAELYNAAYPHLLPCHVDTEEGGTDFLQGFWFVGGGNVSDFYGSYQIEYLKRIGTMFPDITGKTEIVHLFSGSLPPSPSYTRVGMDPTGQYQSDLEVDAHELSSKLGFKPKLIYADPPYSAEDSEHYKNSMVNRSKIMEEVGRVLQPGGFCVWMDQALPIFSNEYLRFCGCISYIRSTGNRFRCVVIFQKKGSK